MNLSTVSSSFTTVDDLTPVIIQDETYTPKMFAVDGCRRFDRRLRTMHELCGFGCVQGLIRLKKLHKVCWQFVSGYEQCMSYVGLGVSKVWLGCRNYIIML